MSAERHSVGVFIGKDLGEPKMADCPLPTAFGVQPAANIVSSADWNPGQGVVKSENPPLTVTGSVVGLRGNLVPDGANVNVTGMIQLKFSGSANCSDSKELCCEAVTRGQYQEGELLVVRNGGPVGGSGKQQRLSTIAAMNRRETGKKVALLTDGRFSRAPGGFCFDHAGPGAAPGGLKGLMEDGDIVAVNAEPGNLELNAGDDVLEMRKTDWRAPELAYSSGTLWQCPQTAETAKNSAVPHPGGQVEVVCYADI